MKKIVCVLSALTLMTSPLSAYADTAITESAAEKQAETQLTMEVAPTYTVVIPADIKIEEGETFTHFGDLYLEQRVLEPGHLVNVAVDGDFEMKNSIDDSVRLPYDIVTSYELVIEEGEGSYFSYKDWSINIKRLRFPIEMFITVDEADWEKAPAGSYSDTVRFYITYYDPSQEDT